MTTVSRSGSSSVRRDGMSPIGMWLAPGKAASEISKGSRTSRMKTRSPRSRRALSAAGSIAPISGITRPARAALLFDVVRKQLDLRVHRQLGARNRKSERVGLTRQDRFEMRLLVQNFLNVLVVSQACGLMVVEALAVEDFAVLVLEREVQKHVVDRPVA